MDLRQILSLLLRKWPVWVACLMVGLLAALGFSLLQKPVYASKAQLFVVTASGGQDSAANAYQGNLASQQRVASYAKLVNGLDVMQRVEDRGQFGLSASQLAKKVSASTAPQTVLLDITVQDTDPIEAQRIAKITGDVFSEFVIDLETPAPGQQPTTYLKVVGEPVVPTSPVSPNTPLNLALGGLLGLLVGLALVVLMDRLDRTVKTTDEIEALTDLPTVGVIPLNKDRQKDPEVPFGEGHSPEAEAYRQIRTNLQFLDVDNPPRVLLLTSAVSSEGKSTTTLNISLALAEAGHRILLVEADLRRPRVAKYFGLTNSVGLTNILSGQAAADDVIQETSHENVHLLASGPLPPNPSELLGTHAAQQLFTTELKALYDYVVIDAPPILPVTDSSVLSQSVDAVIVAIRSNSTTKEQITRTLDQLRKVGSPVKGTLLTMANISKRKSQYYYYYTDSKK